ARRSSTSSLKRFGPSPRKSRKTRSLCSRPPIPPGFRAWMKRPQHASRCCAGGRRNSPHAAASRCILVTPHILGLVEKNPQGIVVFSLHVAHFVLNKARDSGILAPALPHAPERMTESSGAGLTRRCSSSYVQWQEGFPL